MSTLPTDLRNKLERTCVAARNLAERAAHAALEALAVQHHEAYGHMTKEQKDLRNMLRAHARQLGDVQDAKGHLAIKHLAQECAYEHWHRMLFARFLAENSLLIEPDVGVAISLDECKELAKEAKTNLWTLAGRYAQTTLPEVFRADDPVLQVPLAREDQLKLEQLLDGLPADVFTASDSLGWCYQFWQAEKKNEVNASGNKIGADELPSVTQLFTEDYMVDFLLDNTLGAWWWGRSAATKGSGFRIQDCGTEEDCRRLVALPGCPWKYLRLIKGEDDKWTPAAGMFDGWPKTAKELKCLDPCMGSGHFVVAMFERLVALRMAEEKLDEKAAILAVIRDNLFGLEIDPRCTQIAAFNLALAAWRRVGYCALPAMNLACSGLAPNAKEADWIEIAGNNEKLKRGMERLYGLFEKAPVLGSLINPRAGESDLLEAGFHELQPLLEKALVKETNDDTAHEMAVTARGLAKAADILAGQFTLVATNVPYLGRGKQDEALADYCERIYPEAKADLATCFTRRCLSFCDSGASSALVTPQNWLFQHHYKHFRVRLLKEERWDLVVRLGPGAFETISGEVVKVALVSIARHAPCLNHIFSGWDVTEAKTPTDKAKGLCTEVVMLKQKDQLESPDSRVVFGSVGHTGFLGDFASALSGMSAGDSLRFDRMFWEVAVNGKTWEFVQSTVNKHEYYGGRSAIILWEQERGAIYELAQSVRHLNHAAQNWLRGKPNWGKEGIVVSQTGNLPVTFYHGEKYDLNCCAIVPREISHLPALWAYCSSDAFRISVRNIDQALKVTPQSLLKIPFDLVHWQKVAAQEYPHGLPKPFSSDPTQWLFNGYPKGSDQPLHVAVARLLDYQWPRQTGSTFPDCPALGPDGLEKLADADGIVCIPSVRGEEPAADRLRKLLAAAYGKEWKAGTELELIHATGSKADDLDEWLRNEFFEQHCALFHHRPFIWHIWDGRKRDGFHALVNYHKLAGGNHDKKGEHKGKKLLESLTHSYLGDWINRQKDGEKRGEAGAEERLGAALELKKRLEALIEGEPPFDIFVRWKPLSQQAIGWEPDINDGVRMNIRPFMSSDLPNGKKGAGILRVKPNINWDKDRGKEPQRDKKEYPWFWNGNTFTGDRVNDVHLANQCKRKDRAT